MVVAQHSTGKSAGVETRKTAIVVLFAFRIFSFGYGESLIDSRTFQDIRLFADPSSLFLKNSDFFIWPHVLLENMTCEPTAVQLY